MSGLRRIIVAALAVVVFCALAPAAAAQATTCETPDGRYDVTPLPGGVGPGADPAVVAAANCTLGFDEQTTYPLSVIVLCLAATAVTLLLVRRRASYEAMGSGA